MRITFNIVAMMSLFLTATAGAVTTTDWTEYSSNPVYSPGKAYYPTVLDEGGTYRMWSDGSSGIQMATSGDGVAWTAAGTCTGLTNPRHTLVENIGGTYRMWYWDAGQLYSIAAMRTAVSNDGITWTSDQALTQVSNSVVYNTAGAWNRGSYGPADVLYNPSGSETITEPTSEATVWANKFVMYYDGTTGGTESIGLAVSNDGINWQGYNGGAAAVLAGTGTATDWDYNYVSRCTVVVDSEDAYHMWYSGGSGGMDDGIGYAFSDDGIAWVRDAANPIFHKSDGAAWRSDRTYCPMVIGDQMWFTGKSDTGVYAIGHATPEPATMGLLGLGLMLLRLRRRRRNK